MENDQQGCSGKSTFLEQLRGTKPIVHLLVIVFAISSWIDMNGLWVELPLLVLSAPEQWKLPSYMTIITQIANIGPLCFILISCSFPFTKPRLEKVTSFIIILVGLVSLLLLAFFWEKTTYIAGSERSTVFLTLTFFVSIVDTTSSVSFYAFMSHMKSAYMPSLLLGEGLSGFFPAMVALGQGAGQIICVNVTKNSSDPEQGLITEIEAQYIEPRFSVQTFIIILTLFLFLSGVAFLLLNFLPYCKSEFVDAKTSDIIQDIKYTSFSSSNADMDGQDGAPYSKQNNSYDNRSYRHDDGYPITTVPVDASSPEVWELSVTQSDSRGSQHTDYDDVKVKVDRERGSSFLKDISVGHFVVFQVCLVIINMTLTTFLPAIQVYSSLPYDLSTYHITAIMFQIANPVSCFLAVFFTVKSLAGILSITALGQVGVAYIIYVAAQSPSPPLAEETAGGAIVVTLWVVTTLLLIYSKVCIAGVMRDQGRTALICAGVFTQTGTTIGAIVGFLVVNEYNLFKSAPYC